MKLRRSIIVISGRSVTPETYAEPNFLKMATKLGAVAGLRSEPPGRGAGNAAGFGPSAGVG